MKKILFITVWAVLSLTACAGDYEAPHQVKTTQAEKAKQAANSIHFTENAEIENIKKRLELTADPGLLGFVVLLNQMGQPVMYTSVKGKITSGGKRLTKPQTANCYYDADDRDTHAPCGTVMDAPSDEGTYGHAGEYVYFWTQQGQYIQWNGSYLYSDKPFRLKDAPLVVAVEPTN